MSNSRERILEAAAAEITRKGPLGLRVQDVATSAGVSVPLIYKYFDDRDGLLVEALGGMFENRVFDFFERIEEHLRSVDTLTVQAMIDYVGAMGTEENKATRWLRLQVLAASMEIPALRERIRTAQMNIDRRGEKFFSTVQAQLGGTPRVDPRLVAFFLQALSFGLVLNDLHDGENAISDDTFRHLLTVVFDATLGS